MEPKIIRKLIDEFNIARAQIVLCLTYEQDDCEEHLQTIKDLKKKIMEFNPYRINFYNIKEDDVCLDLHNKLENFEASHEVDSPNLCEHLDVFIEKVKEQTN